MPHRTEMSIIAGVGRWVGSDVLVQPLRPARDHRRPRHRPRPLQLHLQRQLVLRTTHEGQSTARPATHIFSGLNLSNIIKIG